MKLKFHEAARAFQAKKGKMKEQFMKEWEEAKAKNPKLSEESFAAEFMKKQFKIHNIRAYHKAIENLKKVMPLAKKEADKK